MDYPRDFSSIYPDDLEVLEPRAWPRDRQVMGYIRCPDTGRWLEYSHGTWREMRSALLSRVGFGAHEHIDLRIALDRGDRPRRDWGPHLTVDEFFLWMAQEVDEHELLNLYRTAVCAYVRAAKFPPRGSARWGANGLRMRVATGATCSEIEREHGMVPKILHKWVVITVRRTPRCPARQVGVGERVVALVGYEVTYENGLEATWYEIESLTVFPEILLRDSRDHTRGVRQDSRATGMAVEYTVEALDIWNLTTAYQAEGH